jgi:Ribbon-helix-helix protein, copG family
MNIKVRTIEVDAETAELLEARATARGVSISELIADLAGNEAILPAELAALRASGEGPWSPEALTEDVRRLAEFEQNRQGVPWGEVKAWMETWGTTHELPPPKSRKL